MQLGINSKKKCYEKNNLKLGIDLKNEREKLIQKCVAKAERIKM